MYGKGLRALSITTALVMTGAFALAFFWAPEDADQGFSQKIFYVHVPMAIVALCGFVAGAVMAGMHLWKRDSRWDMRSYVAIHLSIILGVGVLLTGSIWARVSWGHWWVWNEPTLVSFLIVFLLYCTYQPLRFSIQDPERQARYASVFAIMAGAFVPLNFMAVRLAQQYTHPRQDAIHLLRRPARDDAALRDALEVRDDLQARLVPAAAIEAPAGRGGRGIRPAQRGAGPPPAGHAGLMPAIPLHTAVSYVAGAYLVFFALILVYVVIMATKLGRIETDLSDLTDLVIDRRASRDAGEPPKAAPPKAAVSTADAAQADAAQADAAKTDAAKTGAVAG